MILEKQKESLVLESGEVSQDSIEMTLDLDSAQFLMQMLSKNIYSDAIGSTIRETCANSLDSMRCSGIDKPIVVTFKPNADGNYEFSSEDFGCGLDDIEVREILSKYGKSTKREDANSLGMWGLGFKSPLAYSSSFHFICRKDGIERKYMMYEGEEVNTIDLLYESPTEECNGVKVIVPIKYSDRVEFIKKIKEQLAYFENIYFDVPGITSAYSYGSSTLGVDNGFIIHREEDFQYSELITTDKLHICLDNVYYPIDFIKLGISEINVPVGLRFGLSDGIFPTINREAIRLTQEAKVIILNKIESIADYFVTKYNESIVNIDDIGSAIQYYTNSARNVIIDGKDYDIKELVKYSVIPLVISKLNEVELLDLEDLSSIPDSLVNEYKTVFKYQNGKFKEVKTGYDVPTFSKVNNGSKYYYTFSEKISNQKKEYLRSIFIYGIGYYLIRKAKSYPLRKISSYYGMHVEDYYNILNLKKYPKGEWRQRIKEFQYIQSLIFDKCKNIDEIQISKEWIDARKKQRVSINNGRRIKLEGEVFGKLAVPLERVVSGKNCKFIPETYKLRDLHKVPKLIVYDSYSNMDDLDKLYYISDDTRLNIRCISFSDREMKIMEKIEIHNLISFKKFMEGNNRPFKKLITAYLIHLLMKEYPNIFSNKNKLSTISKDLVTKLEELENYKSNNFKFADCDVYKEMLKVAEQYSLFDMSIYSTYTDMKELLAKLTFLDPILSTMNDYRNDNSEKLVPVLVDLFKYYKHRIDYKNYKINLDNLLDLDILLTDEIVEELVDEI